MQHSENSGFTLIELAIVLVIIGLLLGATLKGQELINSAKVKNMANDFKNIQIQLYSYQDKYKALPGDDAAAQLHLGATATNGDGDGIIEGVYNANSGESYQFWQQLRLAKLATGTTDITAANYLPVNADGGRVGIQDGATPSIVHLNGTYIVCSSQVAGQLVKQLDLMLDDGNTATGAFMATAASVDGVSAAAAVSVTAVSDASKYTACMAL